MTPDTDLRIFAWACTTPKHAIQDHAWLGFCSAHKADKQKLLCMFAFRPSCILLAAIFLSGFGESSCRAQHFVLLAGHDMRVHQGIRGDSVTPVPLARWDRSATIHGLPAGSQLPQFGSFLTGIDGFDGSAFGVGASEASTMDPQQRLLLQASLASLMDAGHGPAGVLLVTPGAFL